MSVQLVILDRDGVINHESDEFIKTPDEWQPIEGSIEAIAQLSQAGFTVAIATNQSGIGRGLLSLETLQAIHEKLRSAVARAGGELGRIAFCPHLPDAGCDCRKPAPGMLLKLARHYGVDIHGVPFVGDSVRDIQAAVAAGARPILVLSGNGANASQQLLEERLEAEVFDDLAAVGSALIAAAKP
jgi:D-glycero-D-manno-heptose 1,7-bisphosphate phosphatase